MTNERGRQLSGLFPIRTDLGDISCALPYLNDLPVTQPFGFLDGSTITGEIELQGLADNVARFLNEVELIIGHGDVSS
jgi:hypothetical protein